MAARRPTAVPVLFALAAAWLVAKELSLALGAPASALGTRPVHDAVLLIATGLCAWRAVSRPEGRLGWALLAGGVAAWSLGELYYTSVLWSDPSPPLPSPADAGYLLFPPLAVGGIVVLARDRGGEGSGLWVDGLIAACTVAAGSAALVLGTVAANLDGHTVSVLIGLSYPVLDLVLVATTIGLLAGRGWRMDRTWALLLAGILLFWIADSMYLVQTAQGAYESGGWFDQGWTGGLLAIAWAAYQPVSSAGGGERVRRLAVAFAPLVFGAVALGILVGGALAGDINRLAVGLATVALLGVMARLGLFIRENERLLRLSRQQARLDALTGLGNRRALIPALERALEAPDGRAMLALFDLNGFKAYNDAFGHLAGDALLERLGRRLSERVAPDGAAYRLGGDELCVIVPVGALADIVGQAADVAKALAEKGEGFDVTAAYGAVRLTADVPDPSAALRVADARMYAQKHGGRVSAPRQAAEALKQALAERDGGLDHHANAVADLAVATAERLGLSPVEVEDVRYASEMHDIGKIAVPDAILAKPGALTDEEWGFIRRHTITGERILQAAPALRHVAAIVRASHERCDGSGYPDGVEGADIPLGARIIAVADAYDAMVSDRPYRRAMSPVEAIAELRACAGTHFDPGVVDAVVGHLRDAEPPAGGEAALALG
jgi:diguanylate cyclase (GGDEF)-like protein